VTTSIRRGSRPTCPGSCWSTCNGGRRSISSIGWSARARSSRAAPTLRGSASPRAYFATTAEDALDNYRYVATERAVLYDCEPVSRPGNRYLGNESVFLPFTLDGERVGQILVYSHYEDLWFRPPQP
jgi:hypothetical protein